MSTKVVNPFRLKNLTYGDIVQNLSHVSFGNYHLPNPNGSFSTVNNEISFENWKMSMLLRYPNAELQFDCSAVWSKKITIIDRSFQYDHDIHLSCKQSVLSL
ncbi:hypothetical protein ABE426_03240 [Sphingobacterium faecium]|jgi:hypothetical protein|uniref:hypothetical protein n=1 Tax=Sphingobacterium faecium TaxID=34087 RepID=UPI00320A6AF7